MTEARTFELGLPHRMFGRLTFDWFIACTSLESGCSCNTGTTTPRVACLLADDKPPVMRSINVGRSSLPPEQVREAHPQWVTWYDIYFGRLDAMFPAARPASMMRSVCVNYIDKWMHCSISPLYRYTAVWARAVACRTSRTRWQCICILAIQSFVCWWVFNGGNRCRSAPLQLTSDRPHEKQLG